MGQLIINKLSIIKLNKIITKFKNNYNKEPYNYSYIKLEKPIKIDKKYYKKIGDMCKRKTPKYCYDKFNNCYISIYIIMKDKELCNCTFLYDQKKQSINFIIVLKFGHLMVTEKLNYITYDIADGKIIIEDIEKHKPVLKIYSYCDYAGKNEYKLKEKDITIENKQDLKKLKMKCLLEGITYEEL